MAENNAQDAVVVEVDHDDAGSALGDDLTTASTSIKSSVLDYRFKHGRRYHSEQSGGDYSFPNDNPEQDRLDMLHHMFTRIIGDKLFLAPIDLSDKRVLDVGTGTGIWAIDLGDEYPEAERIDGNDISPIQPNLTPPNVHFLVDDVEKDWANPQPYDYIHCRYMAGAIQDWPRLVQQIFDNLEPGGWVEFQEASNTLFSQDGTLLPDNPMVLMMDGLKEACEKIGRTMDPAPRIKAWMENSGFVNVNVQTFKLPVGPWPKDPKLKECGSIMLTNFTEGVSGFTATLFTDILGWRKEEVEVLNAGVRRAVKDTTVHPLFDVLVITGQKPKT